MINWTRNSSDNHSGVSDTTDRFYELKRGSSDFEPLWWVSHGSAGEIPITLSALTNLDAAKFYADTVDKKWAA